jgi:ribosome-associated translation inhibitor RaiA
MKISIRFLGLPPSDAVRWFVERQAVHHLSRFGHEVQAVEVRMRDVNGPRGGEDMECTVIAKGSRIRSAAISELSGDMYQSVATAIARLARTVARSLERARSFHPVQHLPS